MGYSNVMDDTLKSSATIVLAEWRRLNIAAHELNRLTDEGLAGSDEYNAFLESFLLHYRNITDFLEPRQIGRQEKDVTAPQFLVEAPTQYRARIDWRLSHISRKRLDVSHEEKTWPIGVMFEELTAAWDGFLRALSANFPERQAWFREHPSDEPGVTFPDIQVSSTLSASTSEPAGTVDIYGSPTDLDEDGPTP